jgi:protoheme ferro-lyase
LTAEGTKQENEIKKKYLKSYLPLKNRAEILEEEIEQLRQAKMNPSIIYSDMPHSHNITDLSNYAAVLDELEQRLITAKYNRIKKYREILQKIEMMDDEMEKDLLTLRYIRGYKWEQVCIRIDYEWSRMHDIHKSALKNFKM